jgi:hypothetical protein
MVQRVDPAINILKILNLGNKTQLLSKKTNLLKGVLIPNFTPPNLAHPKPQDSYLKVKIRRE